MYNFLLNNIMNKKEGYNRKTLMLYDKKEEEEVSKNLTDIIEKVNHKRIELLDPPKEDREGVMAAIKQFIKSRRRKVYGGWALNELIKSKSPGDVFYTEGDIPDIEFYSYDPLKDLLDLCDILHENKFKFIMGRQAQHEESYTVFFDFEKRCDIGYVPKIVYDRIPTIHYNGLDLVNPNFLIIDVLRTLSDPITSYFRLAKVFSRFRIMQKLYPIPYANQPALFPEKVHKEVYDCVSEVYKFLLNRKSIILFGNVAYQTLMNEGKFPSIDKIPYFEFISTSYKEDSLELINSLKKKFEHKITFVEYYPLYQFYGYNVTISYNSITVAQIYQHYNMCTPYQDIKINDKQSIRIGSFIVILKFLYFLKFKSIIDSNKELELIRYHMIVSLIDTRNQYLKKYNKSIVDDTIFKEFQVECKGVTVDQPRLFREAVERKKKAGKPYVFLYEPASGRKPDVSKWRFLNTSGNIVHNEKNKRLNPDTNNVPTHSKNPAIEEEEE
jgi:hypothetical protein